MLHLCADATMICWYPPVVKQLAVWEGIASDGQFVGVMAQAASS